MPPPDADVLWQKRRLLLASCGLIAAAVIVVLVTQPTHWLWPLLVWGLLVGVGGGGGLELTVGSAVRGGSANADDRVAWARRRVIYEGLWAFFGAVAGVVSAAFEAAWIDLAFTIYTALSLGALGVFITIARRRTRERETQRPA